MDDEFEEDFEPTWLTKQKENDKLAQENFSKNEKPPLQENDQIGNFLFVKYNKYKNRATFRCQECLRMFSYNIHAIKNKKKCKWHKYHNNSIKKL